MATLNPPVCDFGWTPADFRLKGTDDRFHTLADLRGSKGLVVAFICNHCPYVRAVADRIAREARALAEYGVGWVAISANDGAEYPEDSFERMGDFAREHRFTFPYLIDETQEVARAWGAVCTPDFFGFNANLELQYRGRLDASGRNPAPPDARRELFEAMVQVAGTGRGPRDQTPSMGCSIKWRRTPA